jgi:hypothetical protein
MREHQSRGMQRDPQVAIERPQPRGCPIFHVAKYGKASRRQLNAELVASSGRRPQLELAIAFPAFEHAESDARFLSPAAPIPNRFRPVEPAVLCEQVD